MSGCSGPAVTPVCCHRCFLRLDDAFTLPVTTWAFDDGQLLGQEFSIIAPTWTAPLLRAHRRASLGAAGRHPWGWRRIQARRSTCLLLLAVQRRRVESLVLGALSSSPVHRALVLVLGTNIAVLLDCSSRLDSVAFLTFLLTYLLPRKYTRYMYNDDPLRQRRPHTRTSQVTKVTHTQTLLHSKAGRAGRIGLRGGRRRALTQWGRSRL